MADRVQFTPGELDGHWELVAWEHTLPAGDTVHPFGVTPSGSLLHAFGRVALLAGEADRKPLRRNSSGIIHGERGMSFMTYQSYGGTFDIEGDRLRHHVDTSMIPDWVGTTVEFTVSVDGDVVILRTTLDSASTLEGDHVLTWRRGTPS